MSEKDTVLARYPDATATHAPGGHRIVSGSSEVGRGSTETAAWADAARRLANDPANVEETPAQVMGLPPRTKEPAPDVEGGTANLPPAVWPEGD